AEVTLVAILHAQQFLAILVPTATFLPQLGRADGGHQDLLGSGTIHFLTDDALHLVHHTQAERQEVVDSARKLANHAGPHHESVADDFCISRVLLERRDERLAIAHACPVPVTPGGPYDGEPQEVKAVSRSGSVAVRQCRGRVVSL